MSELVLHIGMPKTGTSALQTFFADNEGKLEMLGWAFPAMTKQPLTPYRAHNAGFLMRYCIGLAKDGIIDLRLQDVEENIQRLTCASTTCEHVLLSEESFFNAPVWSSMQALENPIKTYWETVEKTVKGLPVSKTKILLYIRRQDEWHSSYWKQVVKEGREKRDFISYALNNQYRPVLHYYELISTIEEAFHGSCEVVVRLYDRSRFEGGDIFHDFCHASGIPWDSGFSIPEKDWNPSISFDVAEALRSFCDLAPHKSPIRTEALVPLALSLSQEHPDPPKMTPFSKEERELLLADYREGNKELARRYFSRDELFPTVEESNIVWEPNTERIEEYRELFQKACRDYYRSPNRFIASFYLSAKKKARATVHKLRSSCAWG